MLLYKLVPTHDEKLNYCEEVINGIPTPFTIITMEKYNELKHMWHNNFYSYEQIHKKDQLLKLFGTDVGYAEAYIDYNGNYAVAEIIKNYWQEGKMQQQRTYVKIGCDHDWELIEKDNISYTQKCKKCGTIREVPTGV